MKKPVFIIFDGPPSHESGRFVETEDSEGHGLGASDHGADWAQQGEFWALGPFANQNDQDDLLEALRDATKRLRRMEDRIETGELEAYINERRAAEAAIASVS